MKGLFVSLILAVAVVSTTGCATNAPPNLSPSAKLDFERTRVIKTIDLLRDTAVQLNSQNPPLLSTATTRKILNYHTAAIKAMDAAPDWKRVISLSFYQLTTDPSLLPEETQRLRPEFDLIRSVLDTTKQPLAIAPTRWRRPIVDYHSLEA